MMSVEKSPLKVYSVSSTLATLEGFCTFWLPGIHAKPPRARYEIHHPLLPGHRQRGQDCLWSLQPADHCRVSSRCIPCICVASTVCSFKTGKARMSKSPLSWTDKCPGGSRKGSMAGNMHVVSLIAKPCKNLNRREEEKSGSTMCNPSMALKHADEIATALVRCGKPWAKQIGALDGK